MKFYFSDIRTLTFLWLYVGDPGSGPGPGDAPVPYILYYMKIMCIYILKRMFVKCEYIVKVLYIKMHMCLLRLHDSK